MTDSLLDLFALFMSVFHFRLDTILRRRLATRRLVETNFVIVKHFQTGTVCIAQLCIFFLFLISFTFPLRFKGWVLVPCGYYGGLVFNYYWNMGIIKYLYYICKIL